MQEGDEASLNCATTINSTKVSVYWKKDGQKIGRNMDNFLIFDAACKYDGNYTCFTYESNSRVAILKKFVVKVTGKFSATLN